MTEELKPIDVSKYTVTESGNVIRTDNAEIAGKALVDMVKREVEKAEQGKLAELKENLAYAKAVMCELLYNSSEYARQMAMDFLEEN